MYKKYPKTMHLPWSPGLQNDDRVLPDINCFTGKNVIVTEKLDGENTTLYSDYIHARSIDGRDHISRSWIKGKHAAIKHLIPEGWRVCGENMYAKHSIFYENLESYFYVFAIFDEYDYCADWDTTKRFADLIGFPTVPYFFQNNKLHTLSIIDNTTLCMFLQEQELGNREGYVVRNAKSFHINEWNQNIAKYVRKNHVQTDKNWMTQQVIPNKLKVKDYKRDVTTNS